MEHSGVPASQASQSQSQVQTAPPRLTPQPQQQLTPAGPSAPKILDDPLPLRPSHGSHQQQHQHAPLTSFRAAPTTELPPIQLQGDNSASTSSHATILPSLSSVTEGLQTTTAPEPKATTHWPSLNPYTVFYSPGYAQPTDMATPKNAGSERSASSPDRFSERRSASVSLDDPDVRMAAEALGDLRADFLSSPPNRSTPLPTPPNDQRIVGSSSRDSSEQSRPEPLLSLVTATLPLVGTTIEGAASAYNHGKNLSPHLRTGAEYIEDYLSPVARVVGDVGRRTGVEGGVRWILGGSRKHRRNTNDNDISERAIHRRRRAKLDSKERDSLDAPFSDSMDVEDNRRTSVSTIDTLPAYDDQRSPAYSEVVDPNSSRPPTSSGDSQAWKTRIVVSTSSLGVAMRAESLRNLKYCLKQLRYANSCVTNLMNNLQSVVEQYDASNNTHEGGAQSQTGTPSADQTALLAQMEHLRQNITLSVQSAVKLVSSYAGNALPENVREIVREQIKSLPRRWQAQVLQDASATNNTPTQDTVAKREAAKRVLVLAKEGLQMITSVSNVIDRTIVSAEQWCTMLGKESGTADEPAGQNDAASEKTALPSVAQWATTQPLTPRNADEDSQMTG